MERHEPLSHRKTSLRPRSHRTQSTLRKAPSKQWDTLLQMGVFTQVARNIKGFALKFACKSAYASCVNWAQGFFLGVNRSSPVPFLCSSEVVIFALLIGFVVGTQKSRSARHMRSAIIVVKKKYLITNGVPIGWQKRTESSAFVFRTEALFSEIHFVSGEHVSSGDDQCET